MDFNEAREEAQRAFAEEQQGLEAMQEEPLDEVEENASLEAEDAQVQNQEQQVLEDATQTAEVAAQAAAQSNEQLQQVMQELEMLRTQNSQLQGTIDELSRRNEEQIIEEVLEPPTLDFNALAFADEETIQKAQADFAAKMSEYSRNQIMKELSPFVEQAKEGLYQKEKNEIVSDLAQAPEFSGIEGMMPQIETIIKNNSMLSSDNMPLDQKIVTAYVLARGVDSINTPPPQPKEMTADDFMQAYNNNPAFQELVEKQRIGQLKQSQQVPPFSASSGAVNAALNIKEKPKTFEEALERVKNRLF